MIGAKAFYRRRAARILPCLLILGAVLCGLSLAGAALSALGLRLNVYEANTGWLPAGRDVPWSLSIEEVFYLAFPVVCLLLRFVSVPLERFIPRASAFPAPARERVAAAGVSA